MTSLSEFRRSLFASAISKKLASGPVLDGWVSSFWSLTNRLSVWAEAVESGASIEVCQRAVDGVAEAFQGVVSWWGADAPQLAVLWCAAEDVTDAPCWRPQSRRAAWMELALQADPVRETLCGANARAARDNAQRMAEARQAAADCPEQPEFHNFQNPSDFPCPAPNFPAKTASN